jgi:hypothetical protein
MNIVTTVSDNISPLLRESAARLVDARPLMAELGKELVITLRAHFQELDRKPNARGFPRRHFWSRTVRNATALTEVTNTSATVTVASPEFVHKVTGGTITAKRAKALAIPLTGEAYKAERASLFPRPLTMVVRKGRPPLLVETGTIGKNSKWTIHYVLLKSVTHRPDPNAVPKQAVIDTRLMARLQSAMARLLRKMGRG